MAKMYWRSLEERDAGRAAEGEPRRQASGSAQGGGAFVAEFDDESAREPTRRDFLRLAGFGAAGALGAAGAFGSACSRAPVREAIPHVSQPPGTIPGRGYSYASVCAGCPAACGLLVTSRDGRPIKIEGMPDHPLSAGGVCPVGQAAILGLYDNRRFRAPMLGGKPGEWDEVDRELLARFDDIRRSRGAVRLVTPTVHAPAARREIAAFLRTFDEAAHVEYDAVSASAALDANEATHGARVLPRYLFERADIVVSFDADFLGTWISPVEHTAGWARRKEPGEGRTPSWHAQIESRVSITGGKADRRVALPPDEIAALVFDVAEIVERGGGGAGLASELAARLLAARGRSIVLSGLQDRGAQVLCNRINLALGNYGFTLDMMRPSRQRQGDDRVVERLLEEAAEGRVAALLVWRANPIFDLPGGEILARVPLLVSFTTRPDETSAAASVVCPDHDALETWADAEPVGGIFGLSQPLVEPLAGTRAFLESLAVWRGQPRPAREIVREAWREVVFPRQNGETDFERFYLRSVQAGHVAVDVARTRTAPSLPPRDGVRLSRPVTAPGTMHAVFYHSPAILGGEHAWNPLLQELPDPVTKATWDNHALLSPSRAEALGAADGDVVRIEAEGASIELPVLVQPGQDDHTVAIALGYGGVATERFRDIGRHWFGSRPTVGPDGRVGVKAISLLPLRDGVIGRHIAGVRISRTGRKGWLARTQEHHTLSVPPHLAGPGDERRPIVQETTYEALREAAPPPAGEHANLWPDDHRAEGHRWGMAVDLNACTGCGACVIACQVENNIPVAGKDEVRRNRELHWMRIDRYYSEDADGLHIAQQPMFCQHCGHAPCETVCPTLATVHSSEGLNQQVYNRCVGTRYCANNCPYKARRFNWFEYPRGEGSERLLLNPDVTVRTRGVMEKCTMCVQRIQEAKIEAKRRGSPIGDGEVQTACQQTCPARAIVFGDLNDPESRVSRLSNGARSFKVLDDIGVEPSVAYLKIVRHAGPEDPEGGGSHG